MRLNKESSLGNIRNCNDPDLRALADRLSQACPTWIKLPILFEEIYKTWPSVVSQPTTRAKRIAALTKCEDLLHELSTRV